MKVMSAGCVCADVFEELGEIRPGGESLNFCGNICGFSDVECSLIGVVGSDQYAKAIREKISSYPINTEFLRTEPGTTAHNRIYHTPDGDRYFLSSSWNGGVFDCFTLGKDEMEFLRTADIVHTHYDSPVFRQVLELRKCSDFLLAVDFNDYRNFDDWEEIVEYIDVFFISGSPEILGTLKRWSERYDGVFAATLAAEGSVAFYKGVEYRCSAVPVEKVVDTTGAGDSYQAGFMASYGADRDIQKAMRTGSCQAAQNIIRLGGF